MFVNIDIDKAEASDENSIKNVLTIRDRSGKKAKITFAYPPSDAYSYCFIYDVTEDEWNKGISLETLIEGNRKVDIINKCTPHDHDLALSRYGLRCMLFPARYVKENSTYYLINQKKENITEELRELPTIRCAVSYEGLKTGIFIFKITSSNQKKAIIQISGDAPIPGSYLLYRCIGAGREGRKFGIDISTFWNKRLEIIISKEEKIEFLPSPENEYLLLK